LQVVDAVFVCVAVDRDMHAVTHVEVHEVVSKLPTVGPVGGSGRLVGLVEGGGGGVRGTGRPRARREVLCWWWGCVKAWAGLATRECREGGKGGWPGPGSGAPCWGAAQAALS